MRKYLNARELESATGKLLKEMLLRDCSEGQFPPEGAMELVLGEGTKVRVLGPKGGKASMAFTMNVIAAKRFALFKKIVTSARVAGTGALRMDIQTLNGQLLEAFRMKGVVSEQQSGGRSTPTCLFRRQRRLLRGGWGPSLEDQTSWKSRKRRRKRRNLACRS